MTNRLIRMGLQIPNFTYPGVDAEQLFEHIAAIATTAEEQGFDSLYAMDHFYQLPGIGRPEREMFEVYTLLAALAARTRTIRLGAMVGGMTYRNPAFLAKQVTGLDVISGGRAIWGIGAGWFELEHLAYGYEFGTFTDRFEKLEEGLQIVTSMFREDRTTFDGKWFTVRDAINSPRPIQAGGPPVLIGGSGERKTLRMVAQYGDACNVFGDPATVRRLMGVLDEHCERLGRDPGEICRTRLATVVVAPTEAELAAKLERHYRVSNVADLDEWRRTTVLAGTPGAIQDQAAELLAAGLDGLVFNMPDAHELDAVALAADTLRPVLMAD